MAKPHHPDSIPDTPEELGEGGERAGVVVAEAKERGREQGGEVTDPPPPRSRDQTQEHHKATGSSAETGAEEEGDE